MVKQVSVYSEGKAHIGGLRQSRAFVIDLITYIEQFFWLPLTSHLALPALSPLLGVTQGPPLCAPASFSQDEFSCKGL